MEFKGTYSSRDSFPLSATDELIGGLTGREPDAFRRPYGIAVGNDGRIYVSDLMTGGIAIFDVARQQVEYKHLAGLLEKPLGLAIDSADRLYVADIGKKGIHVIDSAGKALRTIGDETILERPAHVTLNERLGRIYVSDTRLHKIFVFDMDGKFLFNFGGPGKRHGQLAMPHGMAFDQDDRLYVADMLNARIEIFSPNGKFIASLENDKENGLELEFPRDVAFTSDGSLYVIDNKRALLVNCDPITGTPKLLVGASARTSSKLGFSNPTALAIDKNDRIVVADQVNKRFTIWQYLSEEHLRKHPIASEELEQTKAIIVKKYWNQWR